MFDYDHMVIFGLGAACWILICVGLSHFAGWRSLALHYRASTPFRGRRFHFSSAQFGGWVGYNGSFTPGADHTGLFVAVWPIFRICHPAAGPLVGDSSLSGEALVAYRGPLNIREGSINSRTG